MAKSHLVISKQSLSYLIGLFVSSSIVQVIFIFAAIHFNYFSGIDPASTITYIPMRVLMWAFAGLLIFTTLKFLKVALITRPCEYFMVGVALGLGGAGPILKFWFHAEYIEVISYIVAIACAILLSISVNNKEVAH